MSDLHFVAIQTYGRERYQNLSCLKLAPGPMAEVVLALFGDQVSELTSTKQHYRYLHLMLQNVTTHQNCLVLQVTAAEKSRIETICRDHRRPDNWVYLWEDDRWLKFPAGPDQPYTAPASYGGFVPKFRPTSAKWLSPSTLGVEIGAGTDNPVSAAGQVSLSQSGDWWWIIGNTYPHRELLRAAGAKWSKKRQAWYFSTYTGRPLPSAIQTLVAINQVTEAIGETAPVAVPPVSTPTSLSIPKPATTVSSPVVSHSQIPIHPSEPVIEIKPDPVQLAIQQIKAAPNATTARSALIDPTINPGKAVPISQKYVGELTGSITGNVQCYGYAIDQGICVFLNFGGPRTAVEAIRARFSRGELVNCVPWDGPSVELKPAKDDEEDTGKYRDFMQNIPEARYTSVILLHERITMPNYGGKSRTCFIRTNAVQGIAMLKHHVMRLVNVSVFDAWADYLWQAGTLARLVTQPLHAGGIDLWAVDLDADAWARLICGGLRERLIQLPKD